MKNKNESTALREAIILLEAKQALQLQALKDQFQLTSESIQPINLIKSSLHQAAASPDLRTNILGSAIGLTTGYLSKKVLLGATLNPVTKILGTVLQFAVTAAVSKNAGPIKSAGENLLRFFSKNSNKKKQALAKTGTDNGINN